MVTPFEFVSFLTSSIFTLCEVSPNSLDAQNDPRECDATKGITDNCVFE